MKFNRSISYVTLLNNLWQSNIIQKPKYIRCIFELGTINCSCVLLSTGIVYHANGFSTTMREAKNYAAFNVYKEIIKVIINQSPNVTQGACDLKRELCQTLMQGLTFQMAGWATAAQAAGGLFSGIGNGLTTSLNWQEYNKNQELNRQLQLQLMQLQGKNQQQLSKQNFEQALSLKGLTSTSSQAGNNEVMPVLGLKQVDRGNVTFTPGGKLADEVKTTGNDIQGLTADTTSSRVLNSTTNLSLLGSAQTTPMDPNTASRISQFDPNLPASELSKQGVISSVQTYPIGSPTTTTTDPDTASAVNESNQKIALGQVSNSTA